MQRVLGGVLADEREQSFPSLGDPAADNDLLGVKHVDEDGQPAPDVLGGPPNRLACQWIIRRGGLEDALGVDSAVGIPPAGMGML